MKKKIGFLSVMVLLAGLLIYTACKKKEDVPLVGNIEGIVTNSQTSQPIQGAVVNLSPLNSSTGTGADGKYNYKDLDPKEYTIQVQKDGFVTNTKTVTVIAGQTIRGDITLSPIATALSVNLTSLDFGTNLTTLPFEIRNTGAGSLTWNVVENVTWLSVNPISGSTTTETDVVNVTVDRTGLSQGNYSQSISVTSDGGSKTITVSLIIANPNAPTVTCANAINISQSTAEVSGNVTSIGSSNVTQRGHCWAASPNPTTLNSFTTLGPTSATGAYTSQLSGLQANTTYYVRAYATNSSGTGYSTEQTFTTTSTPTVPTLTTNSATSITETTASIIGTISNLGSGNIIEHGHCWSTSSGPTTSNSHSSLGSASQTGNFTSSLSNLAPGTTYYVKAFATNSAGTGYSNEVSFTTNATATIPTLSTDAITSITMTGATVGASVTDLGNATITEHGHCWSTVQNPTISNTKSTLGSMNATGTYSSNLTGLSQNTTYYVRAYATNIAGTAYGSQQTFTTTADPYIVSSGLIAYYNFDNQNANDIIGGNNGINSGASFVTDIPGSSGYSASFSSSSNAYIQFPNNPLKTLSTYTINLWIKTVTSSAILFAFDVNAGRAFGIYQNKIGIWCNNVGCSSSFSVDVTSVLLDNNWHMLTLTFSSSSQKMYIDGVMISQASNMYCSSFNSYDGSIMGKQNNGLGNCYYYNGKLDNFRAYNRILSDSEIQQIYNAKL